MNYEEQQNFKYNHVKYYDCPQFNSNTHLLWFLCAVNLTNLAQRILGKYLYEKRNYDFKKIYPFLYWYYHGSYATWALINIIEFFHLPLHCKKIDIWSVWLWEVACFIGLKSICIAGFGVIMAIFVLPCMYISDQRDERERKVVQQQLLAEHEATQIFIQTLPECEFDQGQSDQTSCTICLDMLNNAQMVTFFPCKSTHVFHS